MFKIMGIKTLILTCSSGGINRSFKSGDIMVIKDHIAPLLWTLQNPLVGYNDERFGTRFPSGNSLIIIIIIRRMSQQSSTNRIIK